MRLSMQMAFKCPVCLNNYTSDMHAERMQDAALFGCAGIEHVCPNCLHVFQHAKQYPKGYLARARKHVKEKG